LKYSCLPFVLEAVGFSADADGHRVVEKAIQDGHANEAQPSQAPGSGTHDAFILLTGARADMGRSCGDPWAITNLGIALASGRKAREPMGSGPFFICTSAGGGGADRWPYGFVQDMRMNCLYSSTSRMFTASSALRS
jgi:hypothetical protein